MVWVWYGVVQPLGVFEVTSQMIMDSFQWIVDGTDEQIPKKTYRVVAVARIGENLTNIDRFEAAICRHKTNTIPSAGFFMGVCVSHPSRLVVFCLLPVIVFKGELGIGNFNTHPTISIHILQCCWKAGKKHSSDLISLSDLHIPELAANKLFILGIIKGANRGHICRMAHEHRNNPMIDWNSLRERAKTWIFQFISKEVWKVCWPLHMIALHPEQAL